MTIRLMAQADSNMAALAGKQLPFVLSRALNATAIGARDQVKANLPKKFNLRNSWTRGGIQARMSTKAHLMAQVVAPGYMAIQETGGVRTPNRSKLLAAPAQPTSGVVPKGSRPRALMLSGEGFRIPLKNGRVGLFKRTGRSRKAIQLMYVLAPEQKYEERFGFEEDVTAYVKTRFGANFAVALAGVL